MVFLGVGVLVRALVLALLNLVRVCYWFILELVYGFEVLVFCFCLNALGVVFELCLCCVFVCVLFVLLLWSL